MKEHLLHFFPFLRTEFRKLEESELQSEETFKELFPNESIELWKLRTIYVYQNWHKEVVNTYEETSFKLKPKTTHLKGNFSKEVVNYLSDTDAKV